MKIAKTFALLAVACTAFGAQGADAPKAAAPAPAKAAAPAPAPVKKPTFEASQTNSVTATVKAVDQKTRVVTLVGSEGETTFTAGPEVRNLAQLKVGDKVTAVVAEALSLRVLAKGEAAMEISGGTALTRADPGQKPGGSATTEVYGVANIDAIDKVKKTMTVTGPRGKTMVLDIKDPKNLENVVAGDKLEFHYVKSAAISVEAAKAK